MSLVTSHEQLTELYGEPVPRSITKVVGQITPLYRRWIEASSFLVLSTVGARGVDSSPRGDQGPVVLIEDPQTILLPDWLGNNRIDSLRNLVDDPRCSLMFMIPKVENVVRVNGGAQISVEPQLLARFERNGKLPRSVIVFTVREAYFQCAKAIMRSGLWAQGLDKPDVPSAGQFAQEVDQGFDGQAYDDGYAEYAKGRMW